MQRLIKNIPYMAESSGCFKYVLEQGLSEVPEPQALDLDIIGCLVGEKVLFSFLESSLVGCSSIRSRPRHRQDF